MNFSVYNRQFNTLLTEGNIDACFELFTRTPYSFDSLDYTMIEQLNLAFHTFNDLERASLLEKYTTRLESGFDVHNHLLVASLVEDVMSNAAIRDMVWKSIMKANLSDKELIKDLFESLDVREYPTYCFELFEKYPDYGLLADVWTDYKNYFNEKEKRILWEHYASILNSENTKAKDIVLYSLWVDFFEDYDTQTESWNALIAKKLNSEAVKKLFEFSGPVTFDLKQELIHQHIYNLEMHSSILLCLFGSLHDAFGSISFRKARQVFHKLNVNTSSKEYLYLKEHLFRFDSTKEYWDNRNKNSSTS